MECAGQGKANLVEEILKKTRRGKPMVTANEFDPAGYTVFGRVARESPAPLVRATLDTRNLAARLMPNVTQEAIL